MLLTYLQNVSSVYSWLTSLIWCSGSMPPCPQWWTSPLVLPYSHHRFLRPLCAHYSVGCQIWWSTPQPLMIYSGHSSWESFSKPQVSCYGNAHFHCPQRQTTRCNSSLLFPVLYLLVQAPIWANHPCTAEMPHPPKKTLNSYPMGNYSHR